MLIVVVKIGTIAFELTGLKLPVARFQAISCFTGTGFTTRESELIAKNAQRRKIASVLMIMGYAGFVSLIATSINAIKVPKYVSEIHIPFIDFILPEKLLHLTNLGIVLFVIFILYKISVHSKLANYLSNYTKAYFIKKGVFAPWHFEEIALTPDGSSLVSVEITENSPLFDKEIADPYFLENGIFILALYRNDKIMPSDSTNLKLLLHDKLICTAKTGSVKAAFMQTRRNSLKS